MTKRIPYPLRLPQSLGQRDLCYVLIADSYAIHGAQSTSRRAKSRQKMQDDEGALSIYDGNPSEAPDGARVAPVYRLEPGGSLAVPTGRVLVRFAEGVAPDEQIEEIERAGYEIAERIVYAPQAVWLEAKEKDLGAALSGVHKLMEMEGVENVEPQMIMARAARKGSP
jgi:hypothetical protein